MSQTALNNVGLNTGYNTAANGWKAGTDNNNILLDGLVQPNVVSASTTAPPGSPAAGDRYLVPATGATGAWAAKANQYAVWSGAVLATPAWVFAVPLEGWEIYVADKDRWVTFFGSAWVASRMRAAGKPFAAGTIVGAALTLDLSQGAAFDVLLTANITTWTMSSPMPSPDVSRVVVRVRQNATGGWTLVLPVGTKTPGAAGYTVSAAANAIDLLEFTSYDAGASWYLVAQKAFA
jgi:hypothetical protein